MTRTMRPFVFMASLINTVFLLSAFGTYLFIGSLFQEILEYIEFIPVHFIFYGLALLTFPAVLLNFLGTLSCRGRPRAFHLGRAALTLTIIWDFVLFLGGYLSMALLGLLWRGSWTLGNMLYWGKFLVIAVVLIIALVTESNRESKQEDKELFEKYEPEPEPVSEPVQVDIPPVTVLPHQEAFDALRGRLQNAHEQYLKKELTADAYRETKRLLLLDYEMLKKVPLEPTPKGSATV